MAKYIYTLLFSMTLAFVAPAFASAAPSIEIIEQDQQPAVSVVGESTLRVANANGQTLYIYNITGVRIQSIKVEGQERSYDLNLPKGCYIVKVGKTVRKIYIK